MILLDHEQIEQYCRIVAYAFPEFNLIKQESREKFTQHLKMLQDLDEHINLLGLVEDDTLLGGIRVHSFGYNYYGNTVPAAGLGLVAVDLAHKKRRVCRDMMRHFIGSSREKGCLFAMLYPFRPDFYHRMGFGWGSRLHGYRLSPLQLPDSPHVPRATLLSENDTEALRACYDEYFRQQHGMVGASGWEWQRFTLSGRIVAGVWNGERLTGYVTFMFRNVGGENHDKDIVVEQIVWLYVEAMLSLLQFLRSQADQARHIVMPLVNDAFSYLLADPRHTDRELITPLYHQNARTGIGFMIRALNNEAIITSRPWGAESLTVRLEVGDDLLADNASPVTARFENGVPNIVPDSVPDVVLEMDIQNFAPLMINAVSLKQLASLGLVRVSEPDLLPRLANLFRRDETPVCTAMF